MGVAESDPGPLRLSQRRTGLLVIVESVHRFAITLVEGRIRLFITLAGACVHLSLGRGVLAIEGTCCGGREDERNAKKKKNSNAHDILCLETGYRLTRKGLFVYVPVGLWRAGERAFHLGLRPITLIGLGPPRANAMKIKNSLKALKNRHRQNRLVRRKGRVYIINKSNPRFKARQG